MKLSKAEQLRFKLQHERSELLGSSRDYSLLKLKNPPLYRLKRKQQRKTRADIRGAIKLTKRQLQAIDKK